MQSGRIGRVEVSMQSGRIHGHRVSVVKDYADTCQRSQLLRGHCVSVFNNYYADSRYITLLWKKLKT